MFHATLQSLLDRQISPDSFLLLEIIQYSLFSTAGTFEFKFDISFTSDKRYVNDKKINCFLDAAKHFDIFHKL